ncbi:MAG: hypothetical protein IJI67_04495 [Clostridia bacterium]|nr:hypothetical protein [Clostridia bacterium]
MKKVLPLLMVAAIVLSLSACSLFKKEPTTQATTTAKATTAATTVTTEAATEAQPLVAPKTVSYKIYIDDANQKAWTTLVWETQTGVAGYQVQFGMQADPERQIEQTWEEDLVTVEGEHNSELETQMVYASGFSIDMARVRVFRTVGEDTLYSDWSAPILLDVEHKVFV